MREACGTQTERWELERGAAGWSIEEQEQLMRRRMAEERLPLTVTREPGGDGQRRQISMYCPCSACEERAGETGAWVQTVVQVEHAVRKGMSRQGVVMEMEGCDTRVRARRVLERDESGVEQWWWEGWVMQEEQRKQRKQREREMRDDEVLERGR